MYNITRHRKTDKADRRFLSQNKKRWLTINSKHLFCNLSEQEADEFINKKGNDEKYYFFKTYKVR
jgi:hypothetical protein